MRVGLSLVLLSLSLLGCGRGQSSGGSAPGSVESERPTSSPQSQLPSPSNGGAAGTPASGAGVPSNPPQPPPASLFDGVWVVRGATSSLPVAPFLGMLADGSLNVQLEFRGTQLAVHITHPNAPADCESVLQFSAERSTTHCGCRLLTLAYLRTDPANRLMNAACLAAPGVSVGLSARTPQDIAEIVARELHQVFDAPFDEDLRAGSTGLSVRVGMGMSGGTEFQLNRL